MATFEIAAPDGKKYRVEGANEAGALAALKRMLGTESQPQSAGFLRNLFSGVAQGAAALSNPAYAQERAGEFSSMAPTVPELPGMQETEQGFRQAGAIVDPTTAGERYLQAGARGATAGLIMGPAGAGGGLVSEMGAQTAREFDAPKWVEVAAGMGLPLLAGGVAAGIRAAAPSHQAQIGQALRGLTEPELRAAENLMRQAQQSGSPVTWSEALNQVSNGRFGQMAQLQRVAEQSPGGAQVMSPIMSQRLEQSRALAHQNLNRVGPQPQGQALEQVPHRVQGAAENVIQSERDLTNTLSRPAYEATTGTPSVRLPGQEFQQLVQAHPNLPNAIQAVRADPIRYGNLEGLADDSYAVLDQVKKYLDDTAVAAGRAGQNYGASNAQGLSNAIRDTLAQANPRYGSALNIQSIRQRHVEEPLRQGQIGQVSEAPATLPAQRGKILPVGKQETIDPQTITNTVQRLEQQAPGSARDWLRANLQSEWDEVLKAFKTAGADESRGASLWAHLAGNEGRRANLQAYVDALDPSGQTWQGFENMLQVLGAQRYRLPANSATAFNQETIAALKGKGIPVSLEDINPVSAFQGEVKQASQMRRYRINSERLANLLLDPDAAVRLRALAGMRPNTAGARAIVGGLLATAMPEPTE